MVEAKWRAVEDDLGKTLSRLGAGDCDIPDNPTAPEPKVDYKQTRRSGIQIRDRRVRVEINGTRIEAVPDSGADESFISAQFLKKLKRQRAAVPGT